MRPAAQRALAGDRLGELTLAVAVDAGDAEHLAGTHRQADAVERHLAAVGRRRYLVEREDGRQRGIERQLAGEGLVAPMNSAADWRSDWPNMRSTMKLVAASGDMA